MLKEKKMLEKRKKERKKIIIMHNDNTKRGRGGKGIYSSQNAERDANCSHKQECFFFWCWIGLDWTGGGEGGGDLI